MLTKVFSTGEGSGYGPVEYLCGVDPFGKGERKKAPKVISGNPELIKRQIDAVPFKFKYTSGVHSFAPEDTPTDEQIMEVIEATEELAFAGLPISSRSILWVKHEHTGRTELHFLIPRQEVNSGKSFNAFPPGWQQKYDLLRDKFNYKYGWARPDDSERERHWQPGLPAKILVDAKKKKKPNPKAEVFSLTDDLANMAIQGKLANRLEIVSELRRRGYGISRQGKDYITIVGKEGKRTRLKGTLFAENFKGPEWIKVELAKFNKPNSEKILIDNQLAAEADTMLQDAIRKTAQYNSNRYSVKEKENEQCAGKQPIDKSKNNQGNLGSVDEGYSGKSAFLQKPTYRETVKSYAPYIEQRVGTSPAFRDESAQRENVGPALRENPFPDSSSSDLGRTVGAGSEMAKSHRRAVEHVHEWSNKNSQDSFGASSGNYRRQSGESGRYDEIDYGDPERTARQGGWAGEFIQNFRSLKKGTEKLEKRLARINQTDKKLSDIDLGLRPPLENMEQFAGQTISGLRKANETRLLQKLLKQNSLIMPFDTRNLRVHADEAVRVLQTANEQSLLQKLAESETTLLLPNLEDFACHANGSRLDFVHVLETRFLNALLHEKILFQIKDLKTFKKDSTTAISALRHVNKFRQLQNFVRIPVHPEWPSMEILESSCNRTARLLRNVNGIRLSAKLAQYRLSLRLPKMSNFAAMGRLVSRRLQSVHGTKTLTAVCKRERKRERIIRTCFFHAKWADNNLIRWNRVFAEYGKYAMRMKILNMLCAEAHSHFLEILAETRKMDEIQERCAKDPFLRHEYGILKDKIDQYTTQQEKLNSAPGSVENVAHTELSAVKEASEIANSGASMRMK